MDSSLEVGGDGGVAGKGLKLGSGETRSESVMFDTRKV